MSTVVPMNKICGGTGGCEAVICGAVISVLGFHQLGSLRIGDILLFLPLCTPVLKPNLNLKNEFVFQNAYVTNDRFQQITKWRKKFTVSDPSITIVPTNLLLCDVKSLGEVQPFRR